MGSEFGFGHGRGRGVRPEKLIHLIHIPREYGNVAIGNAEHASQRQDRQFGGISAPQFNCAISMETIYEHFSCIANTGAKIIDDLACERPRHGETSTLVIMPVRRKHSMSEDVEQRPLGNSTMGRYRSLGCTQSRIPG
ncbi:hypothetical protein HJB52_21825 [Rhizobium lentis]|uniref:hypothetical protein n=1 Tax=Rhizobium lentis TaxID=1138194 RepID=UPI001C82E0FC|nr:hypothetical protein [Rhizobium lentis]MBX5104465.1 hypothetical protein [Rhizobium lentis]